jgi:hypothetical protein
VSRFLEEQNTVPARRRVRSTAAHEAGHGLLHGPLFMETNSPDLLNGADRKNHDEYYADRKTFDLIGFGFFDATQTITQSLT